MNNDTQSSYSLKFALQFFVNFQSCKPNIESDVKASEEIHLDVDNDVENRRDKKAAVPVPAESLSPSPHQVCSVPFSSCSSDN